MRKALFIAFCLAAIAFCQEGLIRPGDGIGPVKRSMIREDIDRAVPAEAIFDGHTADWPSTTLWDNDPDRRVTVFWGPNGSIYKMTVAGRPPTVWKTREGITLGTTLKELEQLNGKPFTFYAFSGKRWGEVQSWGEGGKLAKSLPGVVLALSMSVPGYSGLSGEQKEALETDGKLRSDDPMVQSLNPVVERIELKF